MLLIMCYSSDQLLQLSQPLVEGRLTGIYWHCNFDLGSKIPSIYFHPSLLELENKSVFESLRIKLNV